MIVMIEGLVLNYQEEIYYNFDKILGIGLTPVAMVCDMCSKPMEISRFYYRETIFSIRL